MPRLSPPSIDANRLSFGPAGADGPIPLRDLTFHLEPGTTTLIAGPSGTGKSLLLSLIAGAAATYPDPQVSGRLMVSWPDGNEVPLPHPHPGHVGFLHQDPGDGLLGVDVTTALALPLELAGMPRDTIRDRLTDALKTYGLSKLAGRDVATLSTGERKRAALAGIEAMDPPLVLLDEPLADLDPPGVRQVLTDLVRLRARRTVVIAEHRVAPLRHLVDQELHLVANTEVNGRPWTPSIASGPRATEIVAKDLTLRLGGRKIFDRASFRLGPGVWGLLGRNGAGKSTLFAVLAGLLRPDLGTVTVSGRPVWSSGRPTGRGEGFEMDLRRRLQVCFQDPREAFFAATVADELRAPLERLGLLVGQRAQWHVRTGMAQAGLEPLALRSPMRLSGGEARRMQVLGALLIGPNILFLDEPTHGLDPQARAVLRGTVSAYAKAGGLVVVATHEPSFLPQESDWIHLPGDGSVVTGTDAEPGAWGPAADGYTMTETVEVTA